MSTPEPTAPQPGRVYLVGAGPGDRGLLTARAVELIAGADVILYDRLIPTAALDGARAQAELLFVGKEGRGVSVPQEQTEALMIDRARAGRNVVRLKGGDPFVFGRGGEEALALRAAGIPYEVVPGVTSGLAAAAYAGIPVTHRGRSIAVALITAHEDPDKPQSSLDWPALAAFPGTLVFYMGVGQLPRITESLIAAGRSPQEPAAVIENGTQPDQRTVVGSLATIAQDARREEIKPPSVTVVGSVVQLSEQISWRAQLPLKGRTIAVTRARTQASELARRLEVLGARVLQTPTIRIQPLPGGALDPSPYDLVCLTSPNGVQTFFERLAAGGRDARSLSGARVAAIGAATAKALGDHGIIADVVPERFVAEALVDALSDLPVHRALVARASQARDVLPDALRARGTQVDVLALYETVAEPLSQLALTAACQADYITFTSSSTVNFFLKAAGDPVSLAPGTRLVSIGPVTSDTLREHHLEPHVQAERHDIDGMIDALLADVAGRFSQAATHSG